MFFNKLKMTKEWVGYLSIKNMKIVNKSYNKQNEHALNSKNLGAEHLCLAKTLVVA